MFKEWKNMTPEEKKTEKFAMVIMGTLLGIILILLSLACCS